MRWIKRGRILAPDGARSWRRSHAAVPTVDVLAEERLRVYYAGRDECNRSHTSFVELDAGDPSRILYEHPEPILPLGELGAFDDCGIMPSWIVEHQGLKYLYYIGWTTRGSVPYQNAIGLALSNDGGRTFRRAACGPLFGPTASEPHFTGSCCVQVEGGGWRIWYLSCVRWEVRGARPEPFYHIKYAESSDGLVWQRRGQVAIELRQEEGGIARPTVVRDADTYRMWYSRRGAEGYREDRARSYRIGYAESPDGVRWERMDARAGIDVSDAGWDSEMIAYPQVVRLGERWLMFYNGNGFGATGFGWAERVPE